MVFRWDSTPLDFAFEPAAAPPAPPPPPPPPVPTASLVAQTALPDTYALELAASFEMAHVVAHVEVQQEVHEEEIQQEEDDSSLEDGEFYVDKLIDRRICVSGQTEYLVRWGGFGEEHDSWEPPEALPKDMMDEFDAAQKAARRDKRARRE